MKVESSIPYRAAVAATVLVAVVAGLSQRAVGPGVGSVALVLIAAGYVVSHIRREHRNVLLKIALAAGLFAAFAGFLGAVRGASNIDDTRVPLTALFLWVQVLHAFDVPRPRDLSFSLASSVALIALAGSLAFSTSFVVFLVVYAALFCASLVLGHLAGLRARAGTELAEVYREARTAGVRSALRPAAALLATCLAASFAVFVFIPRLDAVPVATLPFSIDPGSPLGNFTGDVVHPPSSGGSGEGDGGGTTSTAFDPNAYWGYGESLNLRTRGQLSDELVLRVRSPRGSLYRAQAYDRYDDGRWTSSDDELDTERRSALDSITLPWTDDDRFPGGTELVQTFYVERALPNLIFHAHRAREIFSSATTVFVDDFNSVRLDFTLEEDTIYSVISYLPPREPETLRAVAPPPDTTDPLLSRHLQLPDSVSSRFRKLARSITATRGHTVDKVQAVEDWLSANKRYRIDIPPDPPGQDPIETFVFDRQEGFCEQIATTMTLMLRASGVPARLVTGFGPGERNLFSGYWEVRNSDAHAWVEVFYPGVGWVSYDPTFGVPVSDLASTTFALEPLGRVLSGTVLGTLRDIPAAIGRLGTLTATLVITAGALALAVAGLGLVRTRRKTAPAGPLGRAEVAWLRVEDALAERGAPRAQHETAEEYVRRLTADRRGALSGFVDLFGRTRYAPADDETLEELDRQASRLATAVRRRDAPIKG